MDETNDPWGRDTVIAKCDNVIERIRDVRNECERLLEFGTLTSSERHWLTGVTDQLWGVIVCQPRRR